MIHYHGLPITPATAANEALKAGHAFVSFINKTQLSVVLDTCQSFAIDNGAFSAWKTGSPVQDWQPFYTWAEKCRLIPSCDFAVIPDVIDGDEAANDALIADCPLPKWFGSPVWHMHESLQRLDRLARDWPRICLGSSGEYAAVGNDKWWKRIDEMMNVVCDGQGRPHVRLHGLRMLNPKVFTKIPLASADSTNIGRNIGIDKSWKGNYMPPTKEMRAAVMRARIEAYNSPFTYDVKTDLFGGTIW